MSYYKRIYTSLVKDLIYRGKGDIMADDVKKFKEIFDNCIDESMKRVDMKKLSEQKRQGMIQKFKKAMGV
jgi:hypothetical protein